MAIRTRKSRVKVMLDGEVETLDGPLRFTIRPAALPVLAPVPAEAAEPAAAGALAGS